VRHSTVFTCEWSSRAFVGGVPRRDGASGKLPVALAAFGYPLAMVRPHLLAAALAVSIAFVPAAAQRGAGAWTRVVPLPSPAAAGAGEPGLVSDGPGRVLLSWLEPAGDGGTRFRVSRIVDDVAGEAVTIAQGKNFFVNWADVPAVFKTIGGTLVAHWLERNVAGRGAYDIKIAASDDAGRTWTPAGTPHRDGAVAEHGFVSFFNHPRGGAGLIWLDGREMASRGADHAAGGSTAMALRTAQVMIGPQGTRGIGLDSLVDPRVCDCCSTAAANTSEGVVVAYRDRSDKEIRDISVSRFDGRTWSAPASVHADNWQINGCPVNGPVVAASGRTVAVSWFTQASGTPQSFVAFSKDGGRTFGAPTNLDGGTSFGRLAMVMPDAARVLVGYIAQVGSETALFVRQVGLDGRLQSPAKIAPVSSARASGFPRMAVDGDRVVVAWTEVDGGRAAGVRVAALR
jgi:hypothetical protein